MIGLMRVRLNGEIAPGDSGIATLEFHADVGELARSKLPIGTDVGLAEGPKVVARARVIDVA